MKLLHVPDVTQFNVTVTSLASLAAVVVLPLAGYWGRLALPKHEGPQTLTLFTFKGRVSTFGGPNDPYAGRDEVLALFETHYETRQPGVREYFLDSPPKNAKGTMRRLDPDTFYVACRWDYAKASKKELRDSLVTVTNPKNGRSAKAKPVDWGPHRSTGRAVDISPGLAEYLGVKSDEIVTVRFEVER
jgi:hypothetical protein